MLRLLYHNTSSATFQDFFLEYIYFSEKMGLPPLQPTQEAIRERYHNHLQQASIRLKEHNLLVSTQDKSTAAPSLGISVALDSLRSVHNIASIIRTMEAFSFGSLYLLQGSYRVDGNALAKVAMGTLPFVPLQQGVDIATLPRPWIALETVPQAQSYSDFAYPPLFTLLIGNEERGISPDLLKQADAVVQIPLRGRKNSLNVANAFAILAAEIVRNSKQPSQASTAAMQ